MKKPFEYGFSSTNTKDEAIVLHALRQLAFRYDLSLDQLSKAVTRIKHLQDEMRVGDDFLTLDFHPVAELEDSKS